MWRRRRCGWRWRRSAGRTGSSSSPTRWRWRGPISTGFTLNGRGILRRDGRLTLADGTLAGADIDFAGAIRVLVREVGVTLPRALRMASAVPAAAASAWATGWGGWRRGWRRISCISTRELRLAGVWRAGVPI